MTAACPTCGLVMVARDAQGLAQAINGHRAVTHAWSRFRPDGDAA